MPSNRDMISCAESAHFQNVTPEHVPPPCVIAVDVPSSAAQIQMEMVMPGVKQVLVEQIEDKNSERYEMTDKWGKFWKIAEM